MIKCARCLTKFEECRVEGSICHKCDEILTGRTPRGGGKPTKINTAPQPPEPVAKRDTCGVRYDLMPGDALKEVAKVFHVGAERYGANNWRKSRLGGEHGPINHALKHITDYAEGIPDDESDDLNLHLSHAITNLLFELHYNLNLEKFPKGD